MWFVWYVCLKPEGWGHTYQANPPWPCYNHYIHTFLLQKCHINSEQCPIVWWLFFHSIPDWFPLINSPVQKINLRKRRDSLILGGVISVCIIILLLLAFRWSCNYIMSSNSFLLYMHYIIYITVTMVTTVYPTGPVYLSQKCVGCY